MLAGISINLATKLNQPSIVSTQQKPIAKTNSPTMCDTVSFGNAPNKDQIKILSEFLGIKMEKLKESRYGIYFESKEGYPLKKVLEICKRAETNIKKEFKALNSNFSEEKQLPNFINAAYEYNLKSHDLNSFDIHPAVHLGTQTDLDGASLSKIKVPVIVQVAFNDEEPMLYLHRFNNHNPMVKILEKKLYVKDELKIEHGGRKFLVKVIDRDSGHLSKVAIRVGSNT